MGLESFGWYKNRNGYCYSMIAGGWSSSTDGYVGLKLKKGANVYYGWVRLLVSASSKSASFTIKDYAYNNISNQNILAGQTSAQVTQIQNSRIVSEEKIISKTVQLTIAPNPFSNYTAISFSLPQSQKISITIFDMNGRLIKTLADAEMQTGTHQLTWNASDEKGNAVVAGMYVLKMHAGNYVETKKIVIVK